MVIEPGASAEQGGPMTYQIRVKGHFGRQWQSLFEGWAVVLQDDGSTLLCGPVIDQAALFGLLKKIRDLGLSLLSVNAIREEAQEDPGDYA